MRQKAFIGVTVFILLSMALITLGAYSLVAQNVINTIVRPIAPYPVACAQDVKQCSDGSYVSRVRPKCEFEECPKPGVTPGSVIGQCPPGTIQTGETNSIPPSPICEPVESEIVIIKEGQRRNHLLVQKIYPTYITGLSFIEYPVASDQGRPITLDVGGSTSNGCTITLTLIKIQEGTATFIEKIDNSRPCPICLAENVLIDTPIGQIPVQELQEGMSVWTVDRLGKKTSATIIKTAKTPVPKTHQMIHVALVDGREIFASPGHPIGDGRLFDNLSVGDILNGSKIILSEKVGYDKHYTYDILPEGLTGFYFANGILIGSTLQ